jgi:adenylate cyclase
MPLYCRVEANTVLLADDNLIVREGVQALLRRDPTIEIIGVTDYDELIGQAVALAPQVLVTDIRMPPTFMDEGIEAVKEVRKRLPRTGVVVLSQYDSPEYAVELLSSGAAGYASLVRDRLADSDELAGAIREVAAGGSMLDPEIVRALVSPALTDGTLRLDQEDLLRQVAEGWPVKAIATSLGSTPESVNDAVESLFLAVANGASAGQADALQRLRMLYAAILDREEQGQTLSRLLPGGVAQRLRTDKDVVNRELIDRTERLTVTVLMSDVRGYSAIEEDADPTTLADQLNAHRKQVNAAILGVRGTVMQYVGYVVMAVFGAPDPRPDHATGAVRAAITMHARQHELDQVWAAQGLHPFGLGIGLSTGPVGKTVLAYRLAGEHDQQGESL